MVQQYSAQSLIHRIMDSQGQWVLSENDIGNEAVHFFYHLFQAEEVDTQASSEVLP